MKKKIIIVCLILVMTITFCFGTNTVKARTAMYLQCQYTDECKELGFIEDTFQSYYRCLAGIDLFNKCVKGASVFVPITTSDGSVSVSALDAEENMLYALEKNYENSDGTKGCWATSIKDYENATACSADIAYNVSPATIVSGDSCPSGLLRQKGFNLVNLLSTLGTSGLNAVSCTFFDVGVADIFSSTKDAGWELVPAGKGGTVLENQSSYIDNDYEYVVYKFEDKKGVTHVWGEGYTSEGKYFYAGPNIIDLKTDDIIEYQLKQIKKQGKDFWRVQDLFESRMVSSDKNIGGLNVCKDHDESWCRSNYSYETVIDGKDSTGKIRDNVKEWYDKSSQSFSNLSDIVTVSKNKNLVETSDNLNNAYAEGENFSFESGYGAEQLVSDLETAYKALEKAYDSETGFLNYVHNKPTASPVESATSYIYSNLLDVKEIVELAEKDSSRYYINSTFLVSAIKNHTKVVVEGFLSDNGDAFNILNVSDELINYLSKFYTTVAIMDAYPLNYNLNSNQIARISELRDKFSDLVKEKGLDVYPVVDCKGLLGQDLIDKINKYVNVVKIAIPIILIIYGIVDFTKAVFANDEDKMKKAQKDFITRIGIALLIFLAPTIVNLILELANKVWPIIGPDTCGIEF